MLMRPVTKDQMKQAPCVQQFMVVIKKAWKCYLNFLVSCAVFLPSFLNSQGDRVTPLVPGWCTGLGSHAGPKELR